VFVERRTQGPGAYRARVEIEIIRNGIGHKKPAGGSAAGSSSPSL
jgi:hypothetical protein